MHPVNSLSVLALLSPNLAVASYLPHGTELKSSPTTVSPYLQKRQFIQYGNFSLSLQDAGVGALGFATVGLAACFCVSSCRGPMLRDLRNQGVTAASIGTSGAAIELESQAPPGGSAKLITTVDEDKITRTVDGIYRRQSGDLFEKFACTYEDGTDPAATWCEDGVLNAIATNDYICGHDDVRPSSQWDIMDQDNLLVGHVFHCMGNGQDCTLPGNAPTKEVNIGDSASPQ